MAFSTSTSQPALPPVAEYEAFLATVQEAFVVTPGPLFTTDATGLFQLFLDHLPEAARSEYTCSACRRFVDRFGGLVRLDPKGLAAPVLWVPETAPAFFQPAVQQLRQRVAQARLTGVFLTERLTLGQPTTGVWQHLAVTLPPTWVFKSLVRRASQAMAEKRADFKILLAGLAAFPVAAVEQAITLLKTDSLYRSEKCLGVAEWLKALHDQRATTPHERWRENLTWLAVATAPVGYCHVRSTMIGTLLEDIVAGLPFESIAARFAAKMHPLQYQRPQAAPAAGNIAQAEKIIEQLKAAGALERRFARQDEIPLLWQPTPPPARAEAAAGGVFAHLRPKKANAGPLVDVPPVVMTWEKFSKMVLPPAQQIEYLVPATRESYCALLTAVQPEAPPILQWDFAEHRNPVSWYVYHNGSEPQAWNLVAGAWCAVTGVCLQPSMWDAQRSFTHQGTSVLFILQGAKDLHYQAAGLGLFPEILKAEFHAIRATLEAYSRKGQLSGFEAASACGLRLQKNSAWHATFRVTPATGNSITYCLDRWD